MALDLSLLPLKLQRQMEGFAEEIPAAMKRARDSVSGGASLTLWFGANDNTTRIEIRDNLSKLRSYMMAHKIQCQLGVARPADENALAEHVTGGVVGGGGFNSAARVNAGLFNGSIGILNLSPNFTNLPNYAAGTVATYNGQDRFQTVVHEISHIVLGTTDEKLASGDTAYTGSLARQLATEDAAKAKKNAENWGMFIEEFR